MRLLLANHSTYPRVGEGAHAQRLRRAYAQRESGKIDQATFDDIVRDYVREVIEEQQTAGLDVVTDGLVYAYDIVAHPASRLENVKIAGIVRFFDTNTYVRQPQPIGTPTGTFGVAQDFERAKLLTNKRLKAVITGPYTLARHSIIGDKGNGDFLHTATAYADALGSELEALNAAGATFVQIDEPSLLQQPEDAELVRNLLARATAHKGDTTVGLTTYFGDATTIYGELLKMPVDVVGFDLIYGPALAEAIVHDGSDLPLALGAIDGRNTKLEDAQATAHALGRILEALDARGVREVHLQPSCGLEFLPRDRAKRKLERMREIADAITKANA